MPRGGEDGLRPNRRPWVREGALSTITGTARGGSAYRGA